MSEERLNSTALGIGLFFLAVLLFVLTIYLNGMAGRSPVFNHSVLLEARQPEAGVPRESVKETRDETVLPSSSTPPPSPPKFFLGTRPPEKSRNK